jgi:ABC-2 type transport system ATP-binding protein/lipopolysaccharide transport system ATP-binding protein
MASIHLRDVSIEFPIYQSSSRSLKKALLSASTNGNFARDALDRVNVRALSGLSFDVMEGDRLALVGANGAGKTTLLKVLAGIYEPTRGSVTSEGHISTILDPGLGFNAEATGYENIVLRGMYMDIPPREMRRYAAEIAEFSELGAYLAMPVRTYSAGMRVRLAFAVATCITPEILIMDEWLSAGDAHFIHKAQERMAAFVDRSSIMILASHSLDLLKQWCNRAILLDQGQIKMIGTVDEVLAAYASA